MPAAAGFSPSLSADGLFGPLTVGGLLSARAVAGPATDPRAGKGSSGTSLFGVNLGPAARDSLMAVLLVFGTGALIFALMFADGLGLGPRHPVWRRRFTRRLRHPQLPRLATRRERGRLRLIRRRM